MTLKKIGVFGGDLFWSNLPYEALNYYEEIKKKNNHTNVDLILFSNDIRLNKEVPSHIYFPGSDDRA